MIVLSFEYRMHIQDECNFFKQDYLKNTLSYKPTAK